MFYHIPGEPGQEKGPLKAEKTQLVTTRKRRKNQKAQPHAQFIYRLISSLVSLNR